MNTTAHPDGHRTLGTGGKAQPPSGGQEREAPEVTTRFAIEDNDHGEVVSLHGDLASATSALELLSLIPWGEAPNIAPCLTGATCSRDYEIVEYDASRTPWACIRRHTGLRISAEGLRWNPWLQPDPA